MPFSKNSCRLFGIAVIPAGWAAAKLAEPLWWLNPPPPDVSGYTPKPLPAHTGAADDVAGVAQRFAIGRDIPGDWWHLFGSPPLRSLVERALHNNPDLAAAQSALRVARANTAAGQGAFFPNIDGGLGASRQLNGVASPTGIAPETSIFNLFTGQVQVSYSPDVFGGVRRNVESLQAQADNQRFQLEATYLTLTANIVVAAVQEASLRGQIAVTYKLIKIATDVLHTLREQRSAGVISEVDIAQQEATLAQIEQTLPPLQRQLRSSAICFQRSRAVFRARSHQRPSNLLRCICPAICRSACRRNWLSNAPMCVLPKRICIPLVH